MLAVECLWALDIQCLAKDHTRHLRLPVSDGHLWLVHLVKDCHLEQYLLVLDLIQLFQIWEDSLALALPEGMLIDINSS